MPEAESELACGFNIEYSSMKFALFFMAEYAHMVTLGAVAVTLFLGGWQPLLACARFHSRGRLVLHEALCLPLLLHLGAGNLPETPV